MAKKQLRDRFYLFIATLTFKVSQWIFNLFHKTKHFNLDLIKEGGGIRGHLILSNHTSPIEGFMLGNFFYPYSECSPVSVRDQYDNPTNHWLFVAARSIPIDAFSSGSYDLKENNLEITIKDIQKAVKEGRNVVIYPSGKLTTTGREELFGNSLLERLFKNGFRPPIILVRNTGFWGSFLSCNYHRRTPDIVTDGLVHWKRVFKNAFFFTPKRNLTFDFEKPNDFPYEGNRVQINDYLEKWFNAPFPDGEPATYTPAYFWQSELEIPKFDEDLPKPAYSNLHEKEIINLIAQEFSLNASTLKTSTSLGKDLGLDSLDISKIVFLLQEKYDLDNPFITDLNTIKDIVRWVSFNVTPQFPAWLIPRPLLNPLPEQTMKPTICRVSLEKIHFCSVADLAHPPLDSRTFKKKILKYAKKLSHIDAKELGILLPNDVESMAAVLALLYLDKIPVFIRDHRVTGPEFVPPQLPVLTSTTYLEERNQSPLKQVSYQLINIDYLPSRLIPPRLHKIWPKNKILFSTVEQHAYTLQNALNDFQHIEKKPTALVHALKQPEELAINLALLLQGVPVYFVSSYRRSSHLLMTFMKNWQITNAFCNPEIYEKLNKLSLNSTSLGNLTFEPIKAPKAETKQ